MSFMPIEEIHGDHLLKPQTADSVSLDQLDLRPLLQQLDKPVLSLLVKPWLGQTVIEVKTATGVMLYDTPDLNPITPLSEAVIKKILADQLLAEFNIVSIQRLTEVPNEVRGRAAPLWQVQLDGNENTSIYVSEQSGEIVAKRTDRWRLFDFMWMLHIMDYDERSDFNHPLLYLTALSALLFTFSGFVLLFFSFKRYKKPVNK
jgi:hypothetical protein